MKAVILAGGHGMRGRPFTDYLPKAMIPVQGRPIIEYIVKYLSSFRFVDEIVILADYTRLGRQIQSYFENRKEEKKIRLVQDSQSGTGGDLLHLSSLLGKEKEFLLWFVDNFSAIDISEMYKSYLQKKSLACIATRSHRKEETGYAIIENGIITKFSEKPLLKLPMSECLGVYIINTKILKIIKTKKKKQSKVNLSFDVLQNLSRKNLLSAYDIGKTLWIDVESPAKIERNKELVEKIISQMNLQ